MTLLPAPSTSWPPREVRRAYDRIPLLAAWYGGDPEALRAAHGGSTTQITGGPATSVNPGGLRRVIRGVRKFWASSPEDDNAEAQRHLPTPEDISRLSAELLFADVPEIIIDGPRYTADEVGPDGAILHREGDPRPETEAARIRLASVLERCKWGSVLLAAGETGSALGWSALRIALDERIPGQPILARVDADGSIPILAWGMEVGVLFWRTVLIDDRSVWRHLEAHEAGRVWHALYKGDADTIGDRAPLATLSILQPLAASLGPDESITLHEPRQGAATAVTIPNMLPDPLNRSGGTGRSDYTPAVLDLFDAIDRLYSQMMREVEDARPRIAVAESAADFGPLGQGATIDRARDLFLRLNTPPADDDAGSLPIEQIQFTMRIEQYLAGIEALYAKAVHAAGFNVHALVDEEGQALTATEYAGRNRRSMTTRKRKIGHAQPAIETVLTGLLATDVAKFSPAVEVDGVSVRVQAFPVRVEFPAAVQPTAIELAQTATALQASQAASIRTRVRAMHPDWTARQIDDEVDEIRADTQQVDPLTFGLGGVGVGRGDGA